MFTVHRDTHYSYCFKLKLFQKPCIQNANTVLRSLGFKSFTKQAEIFADKLVFKIYSYYKF